MVVRLTAQHTSFDPAIHGVLVVRLPKQVPLGHNEFATSQ